MTDQTIDTQEAARRARETLERQTDQRVQSVVDIVTAANDAATARTAAADADARHSKAWADALASGWSEKDLRATGAPRPANIRATAKTPRTSRRTAPAAPPEAVEAQHE